MRRDQQYRGRSVFVPAQELHHRCVRRVAQQGHGAAAMGDEDAARLGVLILTLISLGVIGLVYRLNPEKV